MLSQLSQRLCHKMAT